MHRGWTGLALVATGVAMFLTFRSAGGPDPVAASPTPPPASTAGDARDRELERLAAALQAERAAREVLAGEVETLRAEVARLHAAEEPEAPPAAPPAGTTPAQAAGFAPPFFDDAALRAAGFDEREIERLRTRIEATELEGLYLRDRAIREGWIGTPRFGEEARRIAARTTELRQELGDDRYDWLLFAAGRSNRVLVQGVLDRSPAGNAGLRAGDAILSYGDTRLFDALALRDATSQGRAGESVTLEVTRDGERLRFTVPRGPLGIRLEEARLRPAE